MFRIRLIIRRGDSERATRVERGPHQPQFHFIELADDLPVAVNIVLPISFSERLRVAGFGKLGVPVNFERGFTRANTVAVHLFPAMDNLEDCCECTIKWRGSTRRARRSGRMESNTEKMVVSTTIPGTVGKALAMPQMAVQAARLIGRLCRAKDAGVKFRRTFS
jgi:hypothetical protein